MGLSPASGDPFYMEFLCMFLSTSVSIVITMSKEFSGLLCTVHKCAIACMYIDYILTGMLSLNCTADCLTVRNIVNATWILPPPRENTINATITCENGHGNTTIAVRIPL